MKFLSFFKVGVVAAALILIAILLVMDNLDQNALSKKIAGYEHAADSLRSVVQTLNVNIHQKDSILLVSLVSLSHTMEKLEQKSLKNSNGIRQTLRKQDSIRAFYCQQMLALNQNPKECRCD